ncbi:APC family permease [Brevibacterium samyangense]|uniref:APC family permease n=1 Tax=Brevibacterium samyangense TaxID=366888 RepID=A0ABP5ES09_9MICO
MSTESTGAQAGTGTGATPSHAPGATAHPTARGADIPTQDAPSHGTPGNRGFARVMGTFDTLLFGFGAMIGFGWITLTGGWLDSAGTWGAVGAFVAGGVVMVLVGLVYSELVSAMPHAGGEHNYLLRALGPKASVIGSWAIAGGYITVVLFEAVAAPRTLGYMFDGFAELLPMYSVAGFEVGFLWAISGSVIAAIVTWVNIRGVKVASLVQTFVVSFLLLVGLLLVLGIVVGAEPANAQPAFTGGAAGFVVVLGAVPFLFVGFDVIPQAAEELKIAPKKIGQVLIWSVVMAVAFYIVVILASAYGLPAEARVDENGNTVLVTADALAHLFGAGFWKQVVLAGGLAGIITSWVAFMAGSSRLLWAMANSGMIPAWFGKLDPKYRTPKNALLFIGGLAVIAPFGGTAVLGWVVDGGSPMIVLAYAMVAVGFLVLRRKEPTMERPFVAGGMGVGGTVIGILATVLCVVMFFLYIPAITPISITLGWQSYLIFGIWMIAGLAFAARLPAVPAGPHAERQLLEALSLRRK